MAKRNAPSRRWGPCGPNGGFLELAPCSSSCRAISAICAIQSEPASLYAIPNFGERGRSAARPIRARAPALRSYVLAFAGEPSRTAPDAISPSGGSAGAGRRGRVAEPNVLAAIATRASVGFPVSVPGDDAAVTDARAASSSRTGAGAGGVRAPPSAVAAEAAATTSGRRTRRRGRVTDADAELAKKKPERPAGVNAGERRERATIAGVLCCERAVSAWDRPRVAKKNACGGRTVKEMGPGPVDFAPADRNARRGSETRRGAVQAGSGASAPLKLSRVAAVPFRLPRARRARGLARRIDARRRKRSRERRVSFRNRTEDRSRSRFRESGSRAFVSRDLPPSDPSRSRSVRRARRFAKRPPKRVVIGGALPALSHNASRARDGARHGVFRGPPPAVAGGPRGGSDVLLEHADERDDVRSAGRGRACGQAENRLLVLGRRQLRKARRGRRHRRAGLQRSPPRRVRARGRPRRHRHEVRHHRGRAGVPREERDHRQGAARDRRARSDADVRGGRVAAVVAGRGEDRGVHVPDAHPGAVVAHRPPGLRPHLRREDGLGEDGRVPVPGHHAHQGARIRPAARRPDR